MGISIVPEDRVSLIISVDTEADDQWSLDGRRRLEVRNANCLPRLQSLCDRYGVRPTYLVTHEMAVKSEAAEVLRGLLKTGRCEIGSHLHPWSSPPYREDDLVGRYPSQLPPELLRRQLYDLTTVVDQQFGVRPISYRAGRYGLNGRHLVELERLRYVADTSVDPLFNEVHLGGPTFAGASVAPYHPDRADVTRAGQSNVLEVPISSATVPGLPKPLEQLYARLPPKRFRPILKRLGLRPVWLRPSYTPVPAAIRLADMLVARHVPTLNMSFHSSELLAGGSPYHPTAQAVDRFFESLERLFEHFVGRLRAIPRTLREYAECASVT